MTPDEAYRTLRGIWRMQPRQSTEEGLFCDPAVMAPPTAPIAAWGGGLILFSQAGDFVWQPGMAEVTYAAARDAITMPFLLPAVIPTEWLDTLAAVAPTIADDSCYIAGGALRDLVLGREPKDVDIFVGPNWQQANIEYLGEVELVKAGAPLDQDPKSWSESAICTTDASGSGPRATRRPAWSAPSGSSSVSLVGTSICSWPAVDQACGASSRPISLSERRSSATSASHSARMPAIVGHSSRVRRHSRAAA